MSKFQKLMSVRFLYVVMMYIAIYPVRSLSFSSTQKLDDGTGSIQHSYNECVRPLSFFILSLNRLGSYEERSLGIFEAPPDQEDQEPEDLNTLEPRQRIGRYLSWHLRRQLANGLLPSCPLSLPRVPPFFLHQPETDSPTDIWWLISSIFLIAIIERGNLLDENEKWFDPFRVIFELVSAFGGIGLSLGVPYVSFSPSVERKLRRDGDRTIFRFREP